MLSGAVAGVDLFDQPATLALGGDIVAGTAHVVNRPALDAANTFDAPETVVPRSSPLSVRGRSVVHNFPAHSVTVLALELD